MPTHIENSKSSLRIMFFEDGEFGGSVRCLAQMMSGLTSLGCEIGLVSHYRETGPDNLRSMDCVRFWRCLNLPPRIRPRPDVIVRTLGIPCPTRFGIRYFATALRALRQFRPDVAYFNNEIESSIPAAVAAKVLGIPMVCHLRIARDLHFAERLFSRMVDQFIVLTKAGQRIAEESGIPQRKLRQIYDPFDVASFSRRIGETLRTDIPWDSDCVYVIQVGTLNDRKRPMLALDAFAYARARCPNLRLIFAGSGPLHDVLQQAISSRGLGDFVYLIGNSLQIPALFANCDIGLFVSAMEGLGLVILEFMAAGLPIVTWNMPVFEELVVNGETGIIVQKDNAEDFGEALVKLYRSTELRKKLGHNGQRSIQGDNRFYPETHDCEILDVLIANLQKS